MKQNNEYLFVYGTLLDEQNKLTIYLKQNSNFYSNGKFKGRLYDLGEYPGAVLNKKYGGYIYGRIVELINPLETLKYLDDYEGFGEHHDKPNLFIRKTIPVETDCGPKDCWVYLYNLPVEGFRVIKSGNYAEYRKTV